MDRRDFLKALGLFASMPFMSKLKFLNREPVREGIAAATEKGIEFYNAVIQKVIRERFKDTTVLTIAHRLDTIMDSDRIIVMEEGKIVEFDTPNVLLENENGIFFEMVKKNDKSKINTAL